jgi:hypothetical protein
MRTRQEPEFLLDRATLVDAAALYQQMFSDQREPLIQRAERICRGEFSFLGIDFCTSDPIDWQCDPKTGRRWPARYHVDVRAPFCDGKNGTGAAGDVKHVWELNRHEFLIDCAKAFYITREPRYANRVFQLITHWTSTNPYLQGVNWSGPLEVALRSMAWLWSYQFCRDWQQLRAESLLQIIKSFYLHGAYLHRHIEVYTSPNNHLVGEATALYLLGSFFPEFDESAAWRERAWSLLVAEPNRQFYEDGGSTEQSTSYHHYCLGFFLLAFLTRRRQQRHVPKHMLDRLESACEFSMWMTTSDGTVPRLGDTDDARSIRFGAFTPWDFRNFLSLGAAIFQRSDMKAVAETFSEDALWLLGSAGWRTFQKLSSTVPLETSRLFAASGYAILRSDWGAKGHHTCFDCGEIGVGLRSDDIPIFTHGHADMLSLNISTFGAPLLVDAGFYTYNGSPEWHRYTRDVQGHNTVRVNGQSQARFHDKNAWSTVSRPGTVQHTSDGNIEAVESSHSGFLDLKDCGRHRRAVVWNRKCCWLILDRLEGNGRHYVESFFHFAPGHLKVLPENQGVSMTTDQGVHAVLRAAGVHDLQIDARHGESEPDGGWIAIGYGRKEPAPMVRFHGCVQLPTTMTYVLSSSLDESAPLLIEQTDVRGSSDETAADGVGLRVVSKVGDEIIAIWCNNNGPFAVRSTKSGLQHSDYKDRVLALLLI